MTEAHENPAEEPHRNERFHDRVISVVLAAIWIGAALFVWNSDIEIPASMLLIATVFFLMLVPAMRELVKILDRHLRRELGFGKPQDEE